MSEAIFKRICSAKSSSYSPSLAPTSNASGCLLQSRYLPRSFNPSGRQSLALLPCQCPPRPFLPSLLSFPPLKSLSRTIRNATLLHRAVSPVCIQLPDSPRRCLHPVSSDLRHLLPPLQLLALLPHSLRTQRPWRRAPAPPRPACEPQHSARLL